MRLGVSLLFVSKLLVGCASMAPDAPPNPVVTNDEELLEAQVEQNEILADELDGLEGSTPGAAKNAYVASNRMLFFFDREDKTVTQNFDTGIDMGGIDWKKPISSSNPGADCTMKLRKRGPPKNVYACIVREGNYPPLVLQMSELYGADGRRLERISLDGKGVAAWKRWEKELQGMGFRQITYTEPKRPGLLVHRFVSEDNTTVVDVIWAQTPKAVTLFMYPHQDLKLPGVGLATPSRAAVPLTKAPTKKKLAKKKPLKKKKR